MPLDNGNPALVAGPNRNGANSLAKESKAGIITGTVVTIAVNGALIWLTSLDTSSWTGWWAGVAAAGVGAGIALLTAYKKRNR